MKRWLPAILLICVGAAVAWYFASRSKSQTPPKSEVPTNSNSTVAAFNHTTSKPATALPQETAEAHLQSNASVTPGVATSTAPGKPLPYILGSADTPPTNISPQIVVENMRRAVVNYGSTFSGNPVGTNPEIAAALNGENSKQIKFLDTESGLRINGNGELVDSWGTPFFFHQLSATDMEIRSAGPDKIMWTADDLVIK